LAGEKTRAALPQIERIEKPVTLFADLASVTEHPLLDAKNTQQGWPKIIMAIELEAMAQHLGESLLPRYLRLDESSPGAFVTEWQPINTSPEKHQGYAVQWFAMALALMIWFVFANSNLLSYWRQRREHKRRS
jgi:surfeit locus 1 family protein